MSSRRSFVVIATFVCAGLSLAPTDRLLAQPPAGQRHALLVGIEGYKHPRLREPVPLKYAVEDVTELAQVLGKHGYNVRLLTDETGSSDARLLPTRENIDRELKELLLQTNERDTVLIALAGHGLQFKGKKDAYFCPLDARPFAEETETLLSISEVYSRLDRSFAGIKVVMVDACRNDPDPTRGRGLDPESAPPPPQGVAVLFSCSAGQRAFENDALKHGVFFYYVLKAMEGEAEENGEITFDDLSKFVRKRVPDKVRRLTQGASQQSPNEISNKAGEPPVLAKLEGAGADALGGIRARLQTRRQMLANVAEQLAALLEESRTTRVGIVDFIGEVPPGEPSAFELAPLGKTCADDLERLLGDLGTGRFSVVDRRRLQTALRTQKFDVADFGSATALRQLASRVGEMPVVVQGVLQHRAGRAVTLQCRLVQTGTGKHAGVAEGAARLSESEWGMLGRSAVVRPGEDRHPAGQGVPALRWTADDEADRVVAALDRRAVGAHPLLSSDDPDFPFRLRLVVGAVGTDARFRGKPRDAVFRGNECFVPMRKGEVFQIQVEHKGDRLAFMRLLVDGLNTLPEKQTDSQGRVTNEWGRHVSLEEARPWVLDPKESRVFSVRGFVTETGAQGKLREFTVVDAAQSLAGKRKLTDQLGLITAAFYYPATEARALGTGAGRERTDNLTEKHAPEVGKLMGVINIRYVDADELERAGR